MASLDGYSLNEKIDKVFEELQEELWILREEFTELYDYMRKLDKVNAAPKKVVKKKAKKVLEVTESEE